MGCNNSKDERPPDTKAISFAAKITKLGAPPSAVPQGASERRTYFDVDALLDSVESGAIAPLKGRWLVQLHKDGGKLRRRQDLPAEASWSAAELRELAAALGDDFGVLFVALSCLCKCFSVLRSDGWP